MNDIALINNNDFTLLDSDLKIYNYTEVRYCLSLYPNYCIHLYTINDERYIKIDTTDFYENLKKYCTINLNYSLIVNVNKEEEIIDIYITPIVTSA